MATGQPTITIKGQKEVLAALAKQAGTTFPAKMSAGLREAADYVELSAKAVLAPHHWLGTTEAGIHVNEPIIQPDGTVTVEVGSDSPQARAIEAGWYSSGGQQPPADALEAWATSRGITPQAGQSVKSMAFVMARAIGAQSTNVPGVPKRRYGFAMGELKYLIKAVQRKNQRAILDILIRALST